jgi:N-acyl amino acid synthase of PEP-CTERM/exosortase system
MANCITDVFNEYFEMVPATSEELKAEVFKLRYQTYCVENKFLNPDDYQDQMEFDEFDSRSCHYLIRHRKLEINIATTRLILPEANDPDKLFPLEIFSQIDNPDALNHISRKNLAEVSRFCVSKEFRKRKNELNTSTGINTELESIFTQCERRTFPHISLALFACLIKMSHEHNIQDWYAVMEPALIRFFSTLGMNIVGIGPVTNYHGERRPCTINVNDLLQGVASKDVTHWNMLTNNGKFWH